MSPYLLHPGAGTTSCPLRLRTGVHFSTSSSTPSAGCAPDRGILWWEWAGKPTDDARFELLSQVWAADSMLDWFAAWLYTAPRNPVLPMFEELTGYRDDDEDVPRNRGWVEDQFAEADDSGIPAPCSNGGYDPLHLARHATGPLEQPPGQVTLLRSPTEARRETLIVESMVGWYRALVEAGSTLPTPMDRSWHIDVYARPVGYLGTYRRSRVSEIWFFGPAPIPRARLRRFTDRAPPD